MRFISGTVSVVLIAIVAACGPRPVKTVQAPTAPAMDHSKMTAEQHASMHGGATDSSFSRMQARGGMAMGVDQFMSKHTFDITADGGRIALQSERGDSLDVAQIRAHMRLIQHAFDAGDFSTPAFVHAREMPGTAVMTRKKGLISYTFDEIPRGGAVVISTSDAEAKKAIAEFLEAQRAEHHATGSGAH